MRDRSKYPWLPEGVSGRCLNCGELVTEAAVASRAHPCNPMTIGYGLGAIINPDNTPWVPGYRFYLRQASQNRGKRNCHRKLREYAVHFEIDQDGNLNWIGGVKATESTMRIAEELYSRGRPGSNLP